MITDVLFNHRFEKTLTMLHVRAYACACVQYRIYMCGACMLNEYQPELEVGYLLSLSS